MMADTRLGWLLEDVSLQVPLKASTLDLSPSDPLDCFFLFLGKLDNLEVKGADVRNAYLKAKTKEKLYVVAGLELEELECHILVIYKALYRLKTSGLGWAQRIHDIMLDMGFSPCKADPCIWL